MLTVLTKSKIFLANEFRYRIEFIRGDDDSNISEIGFLLQDDIKKMKTKLWKFRCKKFWFSFPEISSLIDRSYL